MSTKHILTQEDLDNNPSLAEQGLKVGDEVELGQLIDPTENSDAGEKGKSASDAKEKPAAKAEKKAEADAKKKADQKTANSAKASPVKERVLVEHEGKTYRVRGQRFIIDGIKYTAADLAKSENSALIASMLEQNSGILEEFFPED